MSTLDSGVRSASRGEWFLFATGFTFIAPFLAMFATTVAWFLWWREGPCA